MEKATWDDNLGKKFEFQWVWLEWRAPSDRINCRSNCLEKKKRNKWCFSDSCFEFYFWWLCVKTTIVIVGENNEHIWFFFSNLKENKIRFLQRISSGIKIKIQRFNRVRSKKKDKKPKLFQPRHNDISKKLNITGTECEKKKENKTFSSIKKGTVWTNSKNWSKKSFLSSVSTMYDIIWQRL